MLAQNKTESRNLKNFKRYVLKVAGSFGKNALN